MINWHHTPARLYAKRRQLGFSCDKSAWYVVHYYDPLCRQESVLDFLSQIDPDGHKQYIEYLEMCEALKDKYTEMGIL